jgi:LmbE family N-acetylglucosaminyl deacetylase
MVMSRHPVGIARKAIVLAAFLVFVSLSGTTSLCAQSEEALNVLMVIAHPDDEAMFAGSVYKITHQLEGNVDLALISDGSGGYRYAHLAEPIYGLDLTDEKVARQHLPAIRKRELMAAGRILGTRNYFFLDQFDHEYTENADTVLQHVWDADFVKMRLRQIMTRVDYDYVFVHLPIPNFHGHHKAATILALEVAREVNAAQQPVVLGSFFGTRADSSQLEFSELDGYPVTKVREDVEPFVFDLTQPIDETGRLDYRIVVNWEIGEHRSQGVMQLLVNRWDMERFWYFEVNDPAALPRTREFFERLSMPAGGVER